MEPTTTDPGNFPGRIALFPLEGAVLLPRSDLPLNIFEPRYLAMVSDAIATHERLIGMILPSSKTGDLFSVGCAGRISQFQETDDGRFIISLTGLCRFRLGDHETCERGYIMANVSWAEFAGDLDEDESRIADREKLVDAAVRYFRAQGVGIDERAIANTPAHRLLRVLTMASRLRAVEMQAIIEANSLAERCELLVVMMEMAIHEGGGNDARH